MGDVTFLGQPFAILLQWLNSGNLITYRKESWIFFEDLSSYTIWRTLHIRRCYCCSQVWTYTKLIRRT